MFRFHFHSVCASICLASLPSLSVTHVCLSCCLPCRQPPPPPLPQRPLSIARKFLLSLLLENFSLTQLLVTQMCSSTHNNANHTNPSYLAMTSENCLFRASRIQLRLSFCPFTTASAIMPSCRGDDMMQTPVPWSTRRLSESRRKPARRLRAPVPPLPTSLSVCLCFAASFCPR